MNLFSKDFKDSFPAVIKITADYIKSTFSQHYVGKNDIQTIDVWDNLGIIREAFHADIVKYSNRYGKKESLNPKDLLKIIHYAMMLYFYDHIRPSQNLSNNEKTLADDSTPD
jgi:endonuclease III-like uncharacterized protein